MGTHTSRCLLRRAGLMRSISARLPGLRRTMLPAHGTRGGVAAPSHRLMSRFGCGRSAWPSIACARRLWQALSCCMMGFRPCLWTDSCLLLLSPCIWHARQSLRWGELLGGLFAAAGPCLERAGLMLCGPIRALRAKAAAVQSAVSRSREFWRAILDALPAGCRLPLSATCRWRHRAHCKHQERRLRLGEPPWQPKTANAAAAARRRRRLRAPLPPFVALYPCGRARSQLRTGTLAKGRGPHHRCHALTSTIVPAGL